MTAEKAFIGLCFAAAGIVILGAFMLFWPLGVLIVILGAMGMIGPFLKK